VSEYRNSKIVELVLR